MWVLVLVDCARGCVADDFEKNSVCDILPKYRRQRISERFCEIFVSNRDDFETCRERIPPAWKIETFLGGISQTRSNSLRVTKK